MKQLDANEQGNQMCDGGPLIDLRAHCTSQWLALPMPIAMPIGQGEGKGNKIKLKIRNKVNVLIA